MRRIALMLVSFAACSSERPVPRTAVVAIPADPGHFNPAITTAAQVHAVADSIFNGLVALDQDGHPMPDLAERWDVEDGGRAVVFHLASNVRWQDGVAFTSKDVAFTFQEVLLRFHSRTRAGLEGVLESIETPDEKTAVFRLRAPYAPLLTRLDVTEAPILAEHVFRGQDVSQHPSNLAPVGTGPFRLESYRRDDRIVLVRNEDYFKPGLPNLERLVFRVIGDETTQLLALERGEVDYVTSLRAADAERLRSSAEIEVVSTKSGAGGGNCILTWIFNLERPALASFAVRRALVLAIDREEILEKVLFGEGEVARAPFSSGIAWAQDPDSLAPYRHDRDEAQALLDASEPRLRSVDVVHFPTFLKYGELLKEQLARVGVDLEVRSLDRAATVETIFARRDFDTGIVSYCNGADPDIGLRRMYDSREIGPVPFSNGAAYRNPAVDELFQQAAIEPELAKRAALYREIQRLVAADLPYFWLIETKNLTAYRRGFRGFTPWTGQFAERAFAPP